MEQARIFIAIGISFAIFFVWSLFFAPQPPETPSKTAKEDSKVAPADSQPKEAASSEPKTEPIASAQRAAKSPAHQARKIIVDTPLYKMTLTEKGGAVESLVLKDYRETIASGSSMKELIHKENRGGSVFLDLSGHTGTPLEQAFFSTDMEGDSLEIKREHSQLRFKYQSPNGLVVEKTYQFAPDSYLVGLKVSVYNGGNQTYRGSLSVGLSNIVNEDAGRIAFEGPSGYIDDTLQQVNIKDIEDQNKYSGKVGWVAIEDRYFMTSIIPIGAFKGHMLLNHVDNTLKNQIVADITDLPPQQTYSLETKLFMGPKSLSLLRSMNNQLDKAINFGWFDFLAKPCLWFMNFIYGFIPNYGIAIIILTIVTRAIFWPLAKKSYKSMGEMRKIQPLIQELREKYKDDKSRMNQEMMTLYKTYKINPMGGCLPMLIQLPVFFALYRMLFSAIELRHAPFFGWINDLSAPDRLFNFSFKIPLMDAPYGIPVLTIIMGASMLLQQKMTPTPGDPAQAKMMMLMPVIFTFIFINFSSGLVLYWLVSNIFSMAQQYYTQKQTA